MPNHFLRGRLCAAFVVSIAGLAIVQPARAAGDLLVAPTRVVLEGNRGTEVILNNIGSEPATYRISLELRRMTADGRLDEITPENASEREKTALAMIRFAPRRVTLTPNQPQAVRVGVQGMETLPDGEYRAHLLFRAIPPAKPAESGAAPATGVAIELTPVYGVTIPVIVRKGNLTATAAIANPRLGHDAAGQTLQFDLSRKGERSVYGEVRVTRAGVADPLLVARGVAIYPELTQREVTLPLAPGAADAIKGDVKVALYESSDNGGALIAETRATVR